MPKDPKLEDLANKAANAAVKAALFIDKYSSTIAEQAILEKSAYDRFLENVTRFYPDQSEDKHKKKKKNEELSIYA